MPESFGTFVSIIMPMYNSERFVRRAIESILNQTFEDFELIVVDDCSTDRSLEIVQTFDDPRLKIISMGSNAGASAARNAGLDRISGRYVTFVDADDWIEDDVLSRAAEVLRSDASIDCLKYGCAEEYFDRDGRLDYRKLCRVEARRLEDRLAIARAVVELETLPLFGYVWNGFYRAELIARYSIRFDVGRRVNEDFFFNVEYFRWVKVLRLLDMVGYHYAKRGVGLTGAARNYSYGINRQKIVALLGRFEGGVPLESARLIFRMYARFCYAALVDGESLAVIRSDELFTRFRAVEFGELSLKWRLLIGLLRSEKISLVLVGVVKVIGVVKHSSPGLFARLKR